MKSLKPLLFSLFVVAAPATAQMSADVEFPKGDYGTMLSGTVTGDEYFDYKLEASGGQEMFAELTVWDTNGNGTIYFNVLPPGSDGEAIYVGSINGNSTTVDLPSDGIYTIRVYLMGDDASSGNSVVYKLDLSIQ